MNEATAIAIRESWGGAAERGLQARQERESIVARVLRPESEKGKGDGDFGIIPGTAKPTLLKPGAEKIADSLNLYPDYELLKTIEDFDRPLFHYQYRCVLRARGSDSAVATGIGSCNSMEGRYRWRTASRVCPKCGQETIFKSKKANEGFYCWAKKGGCGAVFGERDASITDQKLGQIPNEDVFSLVNTIDKMAQKRSMVAAALNLGFSEQFTQDIEDREPYATSEDPRPPQEPAPSKAEDRPVWRGKLIDAKTGTTAKGSKYHVFTGQDGRKFGTFSETIAGALLKLDGRFVEIVFSTSRTGNEIVEEYRDVTAEEVPL